MTNSDEMERFSLHGRCALVTGASRGIGAGIALALAEAGADVALMARSADALDQIAHRIHGTGRQAITLPCDVLNDSAVGELVGDAWETLGKIDVLVNAAGGPLFQSPVADIQEPGWQRVIDLNLTSVLRVSQAVGCRMLEQRGGSIINIASLLPTRAWPAVAAYSAAKSAVLSLTQSMAVEWGAYGVRVNALCPGWIRTSLNQPYLANVDLAATAIEGTPLGRWGEVEDVVGTVIWLASDASSYVTGALIPIDGGLNVGLPQRWLDAMRLG
jgi:NAD(P)-dependent dehydrogenase (short-subunit alcohol dehydrogenase family)